jgi:hypothetical protein
MKEEIRSLDELVVVANEIIKREKKNKFNLGLHGEWTIEHKRGDIWLPSFGGKNIIPTAGLNHILDVTLGSVNKVSAWYIGIFKNNYTPIATNTYDNSVRQGGTEYYGECRDLDYNPQTNRPAYTPAAASGGVLTNTASKAEFNILSNITVYGSFLVSSQSKTAQTGVLIAAKKFDVARTVVNGDVLYVTYEISATSS